ncbi:MAG TPA: AmmeMemoRadiSam system protein A [Pyrinomonadaceae bacterium]|nr:AmmeMemoRadiSam system protein A [Pyrinomonadaceae bacterium]
MGNESSIVFSGIAPHPPIMVPEVGRESIAEVRGSIEAMAELTRRIVKSGAETVVLISPHAPLEPYAFVAYRGAKVTGDFANFRAPAVHFDVSIDEELLAAIAKTAQHDGYEVVSLASHHLDHGTAVPLYFLYQNGWVGDVVGLGYSFLSNEDHLRFGSCIGKTINELGRSVAIVASGDLSHRLKPDAPAGYNPAAYIFDNEVVDALRCNSPDRIVNIDQDLRRIAGECGYRSMLVAIGATRQLPLDCEVLHYEAPFGVGYLVAQLTAKPKSLTHRIAYGSQRASDSTSAVSSDYSSAYDSTSPETNLPALARASVEAYVLRDIQIDPPSVTSGLLAARAACFVSLKTRDGQLRGCIGTIEPVKDTLAEELIANAINAATRDPRFSPVKPEELANLRFSVDVLSAPEPATFDELDPVVYGVIVEDDSGSHRGLLLPDLEGVDTVTKQVEIAARKGGIPPETPLRFWRFRVDRFPEKY